MTTAVERDLKATKVAFVLFMFFMLSFFLRFPSRLPILGALRIDLLVVAAIFGLILLAKMEKQDDSPIAKYLKILSIYVLVSLPFVTWPGTALGQGLPNFIKASIFFFFTYRLVLSEQRLKVMVYIFILANTFRVIEPLFLNLTQGYWGSKTTFGWDQVNRLAGSPHDIINSNGLAFVIASILPFYHYLFGTQGFLKKLIYLALLPILLYTMTLTLSRSGILAVAIIYGVVFFKSNKKGLFVILGLVGLLTFFASLNDVQRDRYLSIFSSDTKSSATAEGRVSGLWSYWDVAMIKPVFGHGLGSSAEANWNFGGNAQRAHNLWLEVLQELGLVGLIIYIFYTKEIYKGFKNTNRVMRENSNSSDFLKSCLPAMQVWLAMNFLFSFASYGLLSYEWYLFGGFSAAIARLANDKNQQKMK
jgi:putative inorganic carbon (HCO3(-)) transporter